MLLNKHPSKTSFSLFLQATIFHRTATSNLFNWALSHLRALCHQISLLLKEVLNFQGKDNLSEGIHLLFNIYMKKFKHIPSTT